MCYMEPNCVSINFGPSHGEKYTCELNSATDEDHSTILEETPNSTFLAIEVNIFMAQLFYNSSVMFSHCSYIRCVWCPVDIRDYEQRSRDRASVCTCVLEREFEV